MTTNKEQIEIVTDHLKLLFLKYVDIDALDKDALWFAAISDELFKTAIGDFVDLYMRSDSARRAFRPIRKEIAYFLDPENCELTFLHLWDRYSPETGRVPATLQHRDLCANTLSQIVTEIITVAINVLCQDTPPDDSESLRLKTIDLLFGVVDDFDFERIVDDCEELDETTNA